MKKICVGLAAVILLAGCSSTAKNENKTEAAVKGTASVSATDNLIKDPQFTKFRASSGGKGAWIKDVPNKKSHGNVGSSSDTAFDEEGSARIRFKAKNPNLYAQPGIAQIVKNIEKDTDYELSLYVSIKSKSKANSQLIISVTNLQGEEVALKKVTYKDLADAKAPKGAVKKHFRQTFLNFNSGDNTELKVSAKLGIIDPSVIDLSSDVGKQTEIRVDEFVLIKD